MNNIPLLKVKLAVPEIPDRMLYSERIKNLNLPGHRAVLITAPAGFGKTTAVLLSLRQNREKIRWYRMEKEDSILPVFYAHLIETLFTRETESVTDSARSLGSIEKVSEEYPLLNAVICQEAWTHYSDVSDPVFVVFDDFHNVAGNSAIVESIRYFIGNMPANVRIIVISRVDTGIPGGRPVSGWDIVLIDEQALRFTKEEIGKLVAKISKTKMESRDIERLHEYSEGWIAGVIMLSQAAGSAFSDLDKWLLPGARSEQVIFDYCLKEVLANSGEARLKTLARIAILPDFTCEDLEAVFQMENAAETIAWFERRNLFIQKYKTIPATCYRFHTLFRNALLSILNQQFSMSEIAGMNLRAAYHYKNSGNYQAAIRFLVAAGKTDEAVRIAEVEGLRFMDIGDNDRVTSLIQAFPEEMLQNNPHLLFLRGASLMSTECDQGYAFLRRSFLYFRQSGNFDLQMRAVGLMIAISYQKYDFQEIKSVISLLPKFKLAAMSKYARVALLYYAFMSTAWTDKLQVGNILLKLIEKLGFYEQMWDYGFKMAKGIILNRNGNLETAGTMINQVLDHPTALVNDHWRTIGLVVSSNTTSLMRDVEASQKLTAELASIAEKYSSDYALSYALRFAAYSKYQTGDLPGAVAQIDESAKVFTRYTTPILTCVNRITQYLWEAEAAPAGPLAKKAFAELNELAALKPGGFYLELCQAITGALLKEAGYYAKAEELLLHSYKTSKKKKARQSMGGAAMHLAELYFRKNDHKLEGKYLKIWGKIAAGSGYVYFREMNYSTLVWISARCIEKGISPDYMQWLISKYFGADNAAGLAEDPARVANDPKAFITSSSGLPQTKKRITIKLFGSFKMVVDGVEIGEKEWKTRKISGILKLILANPDKTISRETLATLFWPESEPKAAFTSLRAAIYELRKTLARFGIGFESADALITEENNGFRLCTRNAIETDTSDFSDLFRQYKAKTLSSEETKALLIKMTGIYDGDFLGTDLYDEWITLSREHYKSLFIEVSHNLARLYIAGGELEQAEILLLKHLKIDPFDENACAMLIDLYKSTNQKNRAASLRRQFEKRFEAEMGVKPDFRNR